MLTKFSREKIAKIKEKYSEGVVVKLVDSSDETMVSKIGKKMTVEIVDDIGQLHGSWENGSSVAINLEADRIEIVK